MKQPLMTQAHRLRGAIARHKMTEDEAVAVLVAASAGGLTPVGARDLLTNDK